jgi:hypothetical protein
MLLKAYFPPLFRSATGFAGLTPLRRFRYHAEAGWQGPAAPPTVLLRLKLILE